MAVTNYYTVNGEIIGEKTAGGTRVDYLTDALGSVTATVNSSAQVVNTYRYKPYGKQLAKTGTGADPAFGWVGSQGYRPTQRKFSDFYVRARHPDTSTGRWTTKDPFFAFPWRGTYDYANLSPAQFVDASGLMCSPSGDCCDQFRNPDGSITNDHCKDANGHRVPWTLFVPDVGSQLDRDCAIGVACNALLEDLSAALDDCDSMCNKAVHQPPSGETGGYAPGDAWSAMELCCQDASGNYKSCGVFYCSAAKADACWKKCAFKHEQHHDVQCKGGDKTPNVPYPGAWLECDAYRVTVQCLLAEATKRCGKDGISAIVRQRITHCMGNNGVRKGTLT